MRNGRSRPVAARPAVLGRAPVGARSMVRCRSCRSAGLQLLHDFGELPLGGYLLPTAVMARRAPRFVNALGICTGCGLVQQAFDTAQDALVELVYAHYQPTYSISAAVRAYQESFLDAALRLSSLEAGDAAMEIGANDGYVLGLLKQRRLSPVGFDPSIDPELERLGYRVFREYFGTPSAREYVRMHGAVKLVVSRHTLEHVFEPLDFLQGIETVLGRDGIALIEVPYLQSQMATNQFQSMGVQHVCFFTLDALAKMLVRVGLQVREAWLSPMDGGSLVVCARKQQAARPDPDLLVRIEGVERILLLHDPSGYRGFFAGVEEQRAEIRERLVQYAQRQGQVVAYGAGGKGQALLNLLGLDADVIQHVIDDTPGSPGKFVPGVGTEVVAWDDPRIRQASLVLITAPTHVREIVQRDRERVAQDRLYVATTPRLHIVTA